MTHCTICLGRLLGLLLLPASSIAQPLFDAHLHYNAEDTGQFSPQDIIERMDHNGIARAVVSSTPAVHAEALYKHAPDRIVPLLLSLIHI